MIYIRAKTCQNVEMFAKERVEKICTIIEKNGNVSTVSGVLNSCTYIGSALSTYVIADLSVRMGWTFTLLSWVIIAALGTLICFICVNPWDKQN